MSESPTCFNAKSILKEISLSRNIFLKAYDECMGSENEQSRDRARSQKKELEEKIHVFQEMIYFAKMKRAIEILGRENVHGPEDVALLLGFAPKDVPLIPYTWADLEKSKDIKEKGGVEEMLVLFACDEEGSPLTGEKLSALVQKKYTEIGVGEFLYKADWYKDEKFYNELGLAYGWRLITKACLPDSYSKRHHFEVGDSYLPENTQEYAIEQFAAKVGVPRSKLKRPEPFSMIYAIALHLVATEKLNGKGKGERLLELGSHWSDIEASDEVSDRCLVRVGNAVRSGMSIDRGTRDDWRGHLGVCLSR